MTGAGHRDVCGGPPARRRHDGPAPTTGSSLVPTATDTTSAPATPQAPAVPETGRIARSDARRRRAPRRRPWCVRGTVTVWPTAPVTVTKQGRRGLGVSQDPRRRAPGRSAHQFRRSRHPLAHVFFRRLRRSSGAVDRPRRGPGQPSSPACCATPSGAPLPAQPAPRPPTRAGAAAPRRSRGARSALPEPRLRRRQRRRSREVLQPPQCGLYAILTGVSSFSRSARPPAGCRLAPR